MGVLIENRSPTRDEVVLIHTVTDENPHQGAIIDTSTYTAGVTFVATAILLQSLVVYTFLIEESDDSGMSGATTVEDARLTAPISEMTRQGSTRNDVEGSFLNAVGVVNVKQFIRITGTATVTGLSGQVTVYAREINDSKPVENIVA